MAVLSVAREYANQSAEARATAAASYMAPSAPPEAQSSNRDGYMMLSGADGTDGTEDGSSAHAEAEVCLVIQTMFIFTTGGVDLKGARGTQSLDLAWLVDSPLFFTCFFI